MSLAGIGLVGALYEFASLTLTVIVSESIPAHESVTDTTSSTSLSSAELFRVIVCSLS